MKKTEASSPSSKLLVGSHSYTDKVLVLELSLTPHLPVAGAEGVSEPLDLHRGHDEVVQGQLAVARIVLRQQVLDEGGGEAVAHLLEGWKDCKG